jgi:hypothetical protein
MVDTVGRTDGGSEAQKEKECPSDMPFSLQKIPFSQY